MTTPHEDPSTVGAADGPRPAEPVTSNSAPAPNAGEHVAQRHASAGQLDPANALRNERLSVLDMEGRAPPKKPKPWEERSHTAGSKIRAKLPGIDAYDRQLDYRAHASHRILLRLERVIGTDRIRMNDTRFMTMLSKKIEEEEKRVWRSRVKERQKMEKVRHRHLIMEGILEPTAEHQDLRSHPVFRVNRMMKRINQFSFSSDTKAPPIKPTEPFEEEKRSGYLFGWHKNHYLKVSTPYAQKVEIVVDESEEDDDVANAKSFATNLQKMKKSIVHGSVMSSPIESPSRAGSVTVVEEEEENVDESGPASPAESDEEMFDPPPATNTEELTDLLRHESLSQARRFLGLEEEELKKDFHILEKPLVLELYEEKNDDAENMFNFSKDLLVTYEREQCKADDFCNKVLRKAL